jgi:hypothetical protein
MTYKIIRYYAPDERGNPKSPNRTILTGLTLEEAQEHCSSDDSKSEGVYFEGYVPE